MFKEKGPPVFPNEPEVYKGPLLSFPSDNSRRFFPFSFVTVNERVCFCRVCKRWTVLILTLVSKFPLQDPPNRYLLPLTSDGPQFPRLDRTCRLSSVRTSVSVWSADVTPGSGDLEPFRLREMNLLEFKMSTNPSVPQVRIISFRT